MFGVMGACQPRTVVAQERTTDTGGRVSLGRRVTLALIRCGIIFLVALGMLRPTLVYTETHKEKATLVLLIDQSRSMLVRDSLNNKTRWDSLRATLEDSVPALRNLGRNFEIKAYTFDAETHSLEVKDGKLVLPDSPPGQADGHRRGPGRRAQPGERQAVVGNRHSHRRPAAGDRPPRRIAPGRRRQVAAPELSGLPRGVRAVARAGRRSGRGRRRFPPAGRRVRQDRNGDPWRDQGQRLRQPADPRPRAHGDARGQDGIIAKTNIKATADGQLLPVDFTYTPETPGEFKLTLEAVAQPGELVTTNNQLTAFVQVLKGGLHVLYIEGDLRVEQKFLRRSLDASRDIKVDFIRLDPRHLKETKPANLKELFKPGKYDVYILGDVDSTAFEPAELEQLNKTVNQRQGPDHAGRIPHLRPGRIRQHAAERCFARENGSPGAATA